MPGKRVQFDDETWHALDLLAKDRMQDFQELADEAFADLLKKYGRPTDLKTALRQSVEETGERARHQSDVVAAGGRPTTTTIDDSRHGCTDTRARHQSRHRERAHDTFRRCLRRRRAAGVHFIPPEFSGREIRELPMV